MAERFNPRVSQLFKSVHFENQQALTETIHRQVNHYNRSQSEPALGALTPSGYSNSAKDKGAKLKVWGPHRGEPADPQGARVKSGNADPDPTILERKARKGQEHPITTCHP